MLPESQNKKPRKWVGDGGSMSGRKNKMGKGIKAGEEEEIYISKYIWKPRQKRN